MTARQQLAGVIQFMITIDPALVRELRSEVLDEIAHERPPQTLPPAPTEPAAPAPTPASPTPAAVAPSSPAVSEDELVVAVEIVVGAVPGLRRMVIEVSPSGDATYSYEVQAVRTGGGSVAVRR